MAKRILAALAALPFLVSTSGMAQPIAPIETVRSEADRITDEAISSFVKTFVAPSELSGHIPRWFGGICLKTQGLPAKLADAVTRRVLEIASMAGAPVKPQPCALNTTVIFDKNPQAVLDAIEAKMPNLLGPHDLSQRQEVAKVRFPVQAWYATTTRDNNGVEIVDSKEDMPLCGATQDEDVYGGGMLRIDPLKFAKVLNNKRKDCGQRYVTGNRLRDGIRSEISAVTVVASLDTLQQHAPTAIADYLALVILSQTNAFGACQKMETIANLLVPGCDHAGASTGLTPGDVAFLKGLYKADTGGTLVAQQSSIRNEMKKALGAQ